jgi:hypothetical protein
MELESYTCENCILQRLEVVYHLFLRCNFARACWESIGVLTTKGQLPNEGGDQDQKTAQDAKCYGNHYSDGMEYLEM